jgi:glycerol-3-phosphate dehydrogenase
LIDHARGDGLEGLITLIGVRFTTGRYDASLAVNLVFRKLGYQPPPCRTGNTPVWGGQIDDLERCVQSAAARLPNHLGIEVARALVHNYGSAYGEIREYFPGSPELAETIGATTTLKAEVIHAVRKEMAQKLTDVVFRRTDLATAGIPPGDEVSITASLMAAETGWSQTRLLAEIEEVDRSSTLGRPEA